MRIYLDTCLLNRPFDNQQDDRVRLETEALKIILSHVDVGDWVLVGSPILDLEVAQIPDYGRREALQELLACVASEGAILDEETGNLARQIQARGIGGFDALHLACAARVKVDVLLSTDDRFVRRACRMSDLVTCVVELPLKWLESMHSEDQGDES
jgi:hypothetical protein